MRTQRASKLMVAGALLQTPLGELNSASPDPIAGGEGTRCPFQNPTPVLSPSGFEFQAS